MHLSLQIDTTKPFDNFIIHFRKGGWGELCPYAVMVISEKYCKIAADSPPVSDTSVFRNEVDVPKTVSWSTSPDDGVEVMPTKDYGIGIDCHSRFLEIIVLVKRDSDYFEYCREVDTSWNSIKEAYKWALHVLHACAVPPVRLSSPLHYCIESTSTYHLPVLLAWEGSPCVINPSLAGATKRKTDKLDARLLAIHDLTGIWRPFYVISADVQDLRVLIGQRDYYSRSATRIGNRINSTILKFGYTVGREGSVIKNDTVRSMVENLISDNPLPFSQDLPPDRIPLSTRSVLREDYKQFDDFSQRISEYNQIIRDKAYEMDWPIRDGESISGRELIPILMTAPGVGERTAITWLANIVDPTRFPNQKAVAAYCSLDPSLKISAQKVTSTKKRKGNKALHSALCMSASIIISYHSEFFGRWGYRIYQQTGKWKKATNAVARRLSTALYFMNLNAMPFSYNNYQLTKEISVLDLPLDSLEKLNHSFHRYIPILKSIGISRTQPLVRAYYACELYGCKGLGPRFYTLVKEFIDNQDHYRELYNDYLLTQQ